MNLTNQQKRTRRKAALLRLRDWVRNQERRIVNIGRRNMPVEDSQRAAHRDKLDRAAVLNSMTNWQRNKFMIAHKGDIRNVSLGAMQDYAAMPHWKNARKARIIRQQIAVKG